MKRKIYNKLAIDYTLTYLLKCKKNYDGDAIMSS